MVPAEQTRRESAKQHGLDRPTLMNRILALAVEHAEGKAKQVTPYRPARSLDILAAYRDILTAIEELANVAVYNAVRADGAGYPELGAAWSMSRQGARKKWPFAAEHMSTREQIGAAPDTVVYGEMGVVWGLPPELMIEELREKPHYAWECGSCLAADGYYATAEAAKTVAAQHAHEHDGVRVVPYDPPRS